MEGKPCPDCRWTMYLMTGRPILLLRCSDCKNWFHTNIKIIQRYRSIVGWCWEFEARFNHTCTKDDLNSILRCDCLAKQVFMSYKVCCDACQQQQSNMSQSLNLLTHRIRVRPDDTLHNFIMQLTTRTYKHSRLPAYTLQRRCGAIQAYLDRYINVIIAPNQTTRTIAYRKKRLDIREALNARQNDSQKSTPSSDE